MAIKDYWFEPRSSEWARIPRMLSKDVDLDLLWCISSFKHWNFKRFAQVSLKALKKVWDPTTIPSFSASLSSWTSWLFGQRFAPQFLRGSSILGGLGLSSLSPSSWPPEEPRHAALSSLLNSQQWNWTHVMSKASSTLTNSTSAA